MKMWVARVLSVVFTFEVLSLPVPRAAHAQEPQSPPDLSSFLERLAPSVSFTTSHENGESKVVIRSKNPSLLPTEYQYELFLNADGFRFDVLREIPNGPFEFFTSTRVSKNDPEYQGKSETEVGHLIGRKLATFCKVLLKTSRFEKSRRDLGNGAAGQRMQMWGEAQTFTGVALFAILLGFSIMRIKMNFTVKAPYFPLACAAAILIVSTGFGQLGLANDASKISKIVRAQQEALERADLEPAQYLQAMQAQSQELLNDPGVALQSDYYQMRALFVATALTFLVSHFLKSLKGAKRVLIYATLAALTIPVIYYFIETRRSRAKMMGLLDAEELDQEIEREFDQNIKSLTQRRAH